MDYAVRVSHYIDPVNFELSRDVILLISGGHIAEVITGGEVSGGLAGLARNTLELGDALAMPGFVNAHCHLDLSHLWRQVPHGLKFHEWGPVIMAGRMLPPAMIAAGIEDAVGMMVSSGTTSVLDISVAADSLAALSRHGLRSVLALESLGFDGTRAEAAMQRVDALIRDKFVLERDRLGKDAGEGAAPAAHEGMDYGFSPHATFSTSQQLYELNMGRAFGEGRILTTHAAETTEEEEFLQRGTGPYAPFMAQFGVDVSSFKGYGATSLQLLLRDWLGPWLKPENPNLVLVHCNYAREADFALIAQTKPSICWCPRSHAFFGHQPWPWHEMLATDANILLGTDSLASNSGLDMLGEIRQALASGSNLGGSKPDTTPDPVTVAKLFKAATVNGRKAMNIAPDAADLAVWALPGGAKSRDEALMALVTNNPPLLAGFSRGQLIARSI